MGLSIAHGLGIPFQKGGINWSRYWATRTVTGVTITANSDTQFTVNWTNNGVTDYTGHKVYISTDGVNFSLNKTIASVQSSMTITGLSAGTLYYLYVVAYKGSSMSNQSNIANNRTYQSELVTYITGLSTPLSTSQKLRLNNLITYLKTQFSISNLSDIFDAFYVLAGETSESSLKNLVKDANHCTLQGTPNPTFTPFAGFAGDGSHGYIDTNFNAYTQGVRFNQNNNAIGILSNTNSSTVGPIDVGVRSAGNIENAITISYSGGLYIRNNVPTSNNKYYSVGSTNAFFISSRNGSTKDDYLVYKNKTTPTVTTTGTSATSACPDLNFYIGALNSNGTALNFCNRQYAMVFFSSHITTAMRDVLNDAYAVYKADTLNITTPSLTESTFQSTFKNFKLGWFLCYGMETYNGDEKDGRNVTTSPVSTFTAPSNINVAAWAAKAAESGKIDYAVLTVSHIYGFSLYDHQNAPWGGSQIDVGSGVIVPTYTTYDIGETSSYKNIVADFIKEFNAVGIKPILYYCVGWARNWQGKTWVKDHYTDANYQFSHYDTMVKARLQELALLGPFGIWIDTDSLYPPTYQQGLYNCIKAINKEIGVIINHTGNLVLTDDAWGSTDIVSVEEGAKPALSSDGWWTTHYTTFTSLNCTFPVYNELSAATRSNGFWFYSSTPASLRSLVDLQAVYDYAKAAGAPLVLSVNPKLDGTIDKDQADLIASIVL